jgi:hypothetical protein
MAVAEEALRVDEELAVAPFVDDRLDVPGGFALQRAAWGNDRDPH